MTVKAVIRPVWTGASVYKSEIVEGEVEAGDLVIVTGTSKSSYITEVHDDFVITQHDLTSPIGLPRDVVAVLRSDIRLHEVKVKVD